MSVNQLLQRLVDELEEGDVPTPLTQPLTLAAVWCDLARLAGEEPPADVAALVEGERVELPDTIQPWHFFQKPFAAALADRYPDELAARAAHQWDGGQRRPSATKRAGARGSRDGEARRAQPASNRAGPLGHCRGVALGGDRTMTAQPTDQPTDRAFADVRPQFAVWHTAHRAAERADDPLYEDRKERALLALARGLATLSRDLPGVDRKGPVFDAVAGALFTCWLDGMAAGSGEGIRLVQQLVGDYLPSAPPADHAAFERFVAFIRERRGGTDVDLAAG